MNEYGPSVLALHSSSQDFSFTPLDGAVLPPLIPFFLTGGLSPKVP